MIMSTFAPFFCSKEQKIGVGELQSEHTTCRNGGYLIHLLEALIVQLGNLTAHILHIRRLVALAAIRHGREVWAIGLEEQKLGRELRHNPIQAAILECHNTTYAK
jgi:hypothetical protein